MFAVTPPPPPVNFVNSLTKSGNNASLVNDSSSPGTTKYYGTDGSGTKGFFTLTSGGVTSVTGTSPIISSGGTTPAISCLVASSSQPGCISTTDWSTFNGKQTSGNYITGLTGDITASGPGSVASTLATVNTNVGTFGSSTSIPSFTVNGKGLITSASGNVVVAPAGTLTGTSLNSTVVSSSLTSVGTLTAGVWNATTLAIANGGTGQTTAPNAINALLPSQTGNSGKFLTSNGSVASWGSPSGAGTVTSVALSDGSSSPIYTISGSPITGAGTLTETLSNQNANLLFSGPSSGGAAQPTFRSLVSADLPTVPITKGGTGQITAPLARGPSGLNIDERSTFSNATYTVLSTDRYVAQTGTLTGPQIVNLPAASSLNAGQRLIISDESGTVTTVNRLTITANGADLINGTATKTIKSAYGWIYLTSNGTNAWSTGVQEIGRGGTGVATVPSDGQLLIGNTANGNYGLGTITAGTGISVTNAGGSITVASTGGGSGTVTSVGLSTPGVLYTVSGSPVTSSGTLALNLINQSANTILSGPASGSAAAPSFRSLAAADLAPASVFPNMIYYFGSGAGGNITCSGAMTLTADMYANNLTISSGCVMKTATYRIFVANNFDISNAPSGAITEGGGNGGAGAATGAAGAAGASTSNGSGMFYFFTANAGGAGGITTGTAGGAGGNGNCAFGGGGGKNGVGGTGSVGNTGGATASVLVPVGSYSTSGFEKSFVCNIAGAFSPVRGGVAPYSAGGGGGNGVSAGAGGGGGGAPGGVVYISAYNVITGTNTNASIITAAGGNGGNGGTATATTAGGGGGASGGPGGYIYFAYYMITGSHITNALDVSGGSGGNGGNSSVGAVSTPAIGGGSGGSGRVDLINILAGTSSSTLPIATTAGSNGSGTTGGTGASATVSQVNL